MYAFICVVVRKGVTNAESSQGYNYGMLLANTGINHAGEECLRIRYTICCIIGFHKWFTSFDQFV